MRHIPIAILLALLSAASACDGTSGGYTPTDLLGKDAQTQEVSGQEDLSIPTDATKPEEDALHETATPADVVSPDDLLTPLEDILTGDLGEPDLTESDVPCQPDCEGKLCGSDGCGASCGSCEPGSTCDKSVNSCLEIGSGVAAFVNELYLPYGAQVEPCCFDLDDDGQVDNAVASLVETLGTLVPDLDINTSLFETVQTGQLAILLEFVGVSDWANDAGFVMNAFAGQDADADYTDNLYSSSGGTFLLLPESLDDEGNPRVVFQGMSISAGLLNGGTSQFPVSLPLLGGTPINLVLDNARIEGAITVLDGTKASIHDGKLGGVIRKTVIVGALNAYVQSACECLGLAEDFIDVDSDACAQNGTPEVCGDGTCADIYNYCSMTTAMFGGIFDIDLDADGIDDGVSIGLQFAAMPASIVGTAWTL